MMATKSVSFDLFEHSRKFTETDDISDDDDDSQHDATATPARDYDGPSPLSLELDRLLVDRTRNPPRIKPAPFSLPAMPGPVPASLLISTLRAMLVSSRPVVLYPSQLRIGKSHHYMLKTTAEAIEKKFFCSADV